MLISETTMQKWNSKNKFYYVQKGYIFTKMGDSFEVKVKDLTEGSKAIVQVKCDFCGNDVNKTYQTFLKQHHEKFGDCCEECQPKKAKLICLEKYGVDNGSKTQESLDKRRRTCLERYGVDNVSKTKEVKEKLHSLCIENNAIKRIQEHLVKHYHIQNIMELEKTKEKIKSTMIAKYGVEHPKQSKEIIEKEKLSNLDKYGYENVAQVPEIKEKMKQTCLKKYGVEYSLQSSEVRNKIMQTLLKHDNVPTSSQQIMLYDILVELYGNCKLNYPCGNNFLDCVIEYNGIKIDIEYDGWYWHQNKQRDRRRDEFVKSQGYKIFRIVGSHKIPDTKIIQESIEELISTDKTFIRINIV